MLLEGSDLVPEPDPRAKIRLPPGAEAEITNCGTGSKSSSAAPFYLPQTWRNFIEEKSWLLNNIL